VAVPVPPESSCDIIIPGVRNATRAMSETQVDKTVDSRGAACPGPLMDLIGAIREVEPGAVIALLSDNDQSLVDVPEWAEESGNEVITTEEEDGYYRILVRKT